MEINSGDRFAIVSRSSDGYRAKVLAEVVSVGMHDIEWIALEVLEEIAPGRRGNVTLTKAMAEANGWPEPVNVMSRNEWTAAEGRGELERYES